MRLLQFSVLCLCLAWSLAKDETRTTTDAAITTTEDQCVPQDHCDPNENCDLPDCACSTTEPEIELSKRPQIVYLTFDDAFLALVEQEYYTKLFDGTLTNPDGCPIRATHFISARSNDYSLVHLYRSKGHEFGSHSITHRFGTEYWTELTKKGWKDEISGMRTMLAKYAKLDESEVVGVRAPYLQGGGDVQFDMMEQEDFEYDCSMPNQEYGYLNMENGIWPYTADHLSESQCQIQPCPTCVHKGVWIQPMLDLEDSNFGANGDGYPCAMLDSCIIPTEDLTDDSVYEMLSRNFERAYNGNTKAPFGLYVHSAWFLSAAEHFNGYMRFVEEITSYDDVWVVPISAGIVYRKNPVTNEELIAGALPEFGCSSFPEYDCNPKSCCYQNVKTDDFESYQEYIKTCDSCPAHYPWLGDPLGMVAKDEPCSR